MANEVGFSTLLPGYTATERFALQIISWFSAITHPPVIASRHKRQSDPLAGLGDCFANDGQSKIFCIRCLKGSNAILSSLCSVAGMLLRATRHAALAAGSSGDAIPLDGGRWTVERREQGQILSATLHHPYASLVASVAVATGVIARSAATKQSPRGEEIAFPTLRSTTPTLCSGQALRSWQAGHAPRSQ